MLPVAVRILDYIEGSRRVLRVISGGAVCRGVESGCARLEQQRRGRRPGVVISRGSLGGGFRILDYIEGARRVLRVISGDQGRRAPRRSPAALRRLPPAIALRRE